MHAANAAVETRIDAPSLPRSRSQIMKDARMTRIQAKLLREGTGKGQEAQLTRNFVAARIVAPNMSQSIFGQSGICH